VNTASRLQGAAPVDGIAVSEQTYRSTENALSACRAQLVEGIGDHARAGPLYGEAASRWQEFGNVPERAYALLGQGRCLAALGKSEAEAPLREARELFTSMGYKRALAEADALLTQGEAAAAV
jgi:hypothetical protein